MVPVIRTLAIAALALAGALATASAATAERPYVRVVSDSRGRRERRSRALDAAAR